MDAPAPAPSEPELEISLKAGELVGKLYDTIGKLYVNPESDASLQSLNKLCVRLVFCLYAEDAGVFATKTQFHDYLAGIDPRHLAQGAAGSFPRAGHRAGRARSVSGAGFRRRFSAPSSRVR